MASLVKTQTQKGSEAVIFNGYQYRHDKHLSNGEKAWRCTAPKCSARIRTDSTIENVTQQVSAVHSHSPDQRTMDKVCEDLGM